MNNDFFYWDKNSNGLQLENQLYVINDINEIFIASAYLSCDGIDILQRLVEHGSVRKENVTVCLSTEFSDDKPSELLIRLGKIAMVRIAKGDRFMSSIPKRGS